MKNWITAIFWILFALLICYLVGRYRLWLVRLVIDSDLPNWLKAILWGGSDGYNGCGEDGFCSYGERRTDNHV